MEAETFAATASTVAAPPTATAIAALVSVVVAATLVVAVIEPIPVCWCRTPAMTGLPT